MELLFESRPEIRGLSGRVDFFQLRPKIHPVPVLEPDSPVDGTGTQLYGTVLSDGGKYRMWYQAEPCGWDGRNCEQVGYAESDNGLDWRKPKLGLVDFAGHGADNNLVDLFGHSVTVFIDPQAPPDMRYRATMCAGVGEAAARAGLAGYGYYTAHSSDGLKWTFDRLTPRWSHFDVINSIYHPGQQRGLVALKRHQRFKGIRRRAIWQAEIRHGAWSDAWTALVPDEFDDIAAVAHGYDSADYYGMGMLAAGAGTVGFLWQFRHALPRVAATNYGIFGAVDVTLVYQAGAQDRWLHLPGRPNFIGHADPPFGQGGVYTASCPVESGDEHRLYFSAATRSHAWHLRDDLKADPELLRESAAAGTSRIGFACWPKWRLFGFRGDPRGTLDLNLGRPAPGSRLFLNYRCSSTGSVRAEIISRSAGEPEQASPLSGDQIAAPVVWRGGPVLPAPADADCVVRLQLDRAEVYAYEVRKEL